MPLFTKKYNLKAVWQDIKKDAEKARGGKKPGGKAGFEALLESLDKRVQSKTPDVDTIMKETGELVSKMKKYAADLPSTEAEFVKDINGFTKILTEIARACEINSRQVTAQEKALLLARNKLSRINQIGDALQMRLDKLRVAYTNAATPKAAAALLKQITALDDSIQKLGDDMGKAFNTVMTLTN